MAERRTFSKKIVDSDAFLDMPLSAQALYFHLCLNADDDGFVGNPKRIRTMIGASVKDYELLSKKDFVLTFPSGVAVIKHWLIHNTLKQDRRQRTTFVEEASTLIIDGTKAYVDKEKGANLETFWKESGNNLETFWKESGNNLETFWKLFGNFLETKKKTKEKERKETKESNRKIKENILGLDVENINSCKNARTHAHAGNINNKINNINNKGENAKQGEFSAELSTIYPQCYPQKSVKSAVSSTEIHDFLLKNNIEFYKKQLSETKTEWLPLLNKFVQILESGEAFPNKVKAVKQLSEEDVCRIFNAVRSRWEEIDNLENYIWTAVFDAAQKG